MIEDLFLMFFSDRTIQILLISTIVIVGVLITISDLVKGRW